MRAKHTTTAAAMKVQRTRLQQLGEQIHRHPSYGQADRETEAPKRQRRHGAHLPLDVVGGVGLGLVVNGVLRRYLQFDERAATSEARR